ncbi:immune inhibitor A domain-containing protein [Kineosporia sp. NBRC 101731]|uniref:immune inhibitor A domain-containing protein n=1 Tax=Kineosporia sp. NBRC 101731 TaxID=3032199 RepID=UPI0024A0AD4F|nr:immune inhibitor A domain-containing protein [Kineosporia sp. NBRC 101731]GLY32587.1 protease [Kineosporia sp. NBRC 101731]
MRRVLTSLVVASVVSGAVLGLPGTAQAAAGPDRRPTGSDHLTSPMQEKATALREEAVKQVLDGKATVQERNGSKVVKLAAAGDDRYVELSRQRTDRVFVILAEFGNQRHASYPDKNTDKATPGPKKFAGPLHNQVVKPGKTDNTTIWRSNFSQKYFQDLYFGVGKGVESLKTYYQTQSSGRYSIEGKVTDWVKLPYNEARYGRSDGYPCAASVCGNTWAMVTDAVKVWVAAEKAKGRTDAQITAELATFDQWDRYDHDGDGDFNEPDGYIDHFQILHAGSDQASGDATQGEDAVWSHRWYVSAADAGVKGPAGNPLGGTQIGSTGIWVGDYTTQAENSGLSTIAHEYGHDLDLPDDYDVSGGEGDPVEFWSLMAQSRLNAKGEGLGTRPGDLGAWNKLMLGWLDYTVVKAAKGTNKTVALGPSEYNTKLAQAALVVLPQKQVKQYLVDPVSGKYSWWGGTGNNLDNTLTRTLTLPTGSPRLSFSAAWDIEDCGTAACDYAFVEVDDGSGFTAVPGTITSPDEGNGIDGFSDWRTAGFDLSAYAGQKVKLRLRYTTDASGNGATGSKPAGLFLDRISLKAGSTTVFSDGAETLDKAWTAKGFKRSTGTEKVGYEQYYIAANRTYASFDKYLKTGPYNFGWSTKPNYVEHFAYRPGLLVTYWDTSQTDNDVSVHPGRGRNLTVDAHPATLYRVDKKPWRSRVQLYDAAFGLKNTGALTLHLDGRVSKIKSLKGNPLFDDTKNYYDPVKRDHGVKVAGSGVKIKVLKQSGVSMNIRVTR